MATIVGGVGLSHVPAIGNAIAKGLQQDPYWTPFFEPLKALRRWVDELKPDVAVVVYNDHGLNFFLDAMPTFAVGAAPLYSNADEGWGLPVSAPTRGDPDLSWRIIEGLVEDEFDITTCQEMLVDHAFNIPLQLLWPEGAPIAAVPVAINTVQHPLPSARRCHSLGQSIGRTIRAYDRDLRVLVVGTGGLSHQLEGPRAGIVNKAFDRLCLDSLAGDPEALTRLSTRELVDQAGSQGVEVLNWLAMRGVLGGPVREVMRNYHIPISNTAAGMLVLVPTTAATAAVAA